MNCSDCQAPVIQQRTWIGATIQQRTDWAAAGCRMLKGHGRCNTCYQRAYRHRELPAPVVHDHVSVVPCRRCGIKGTVDLCADCGDVVDLQEAARWVA